MLYTSESLHGSEPLFFNLTMSLFFYRAHGACRMTVVIITDDAVVVLDVW